MSTIVEVTLWGTTIGHLGYAPGQTQIATFEYDDTFVRLGISISPIKLPYPPPLHFFDDTNTKTFKGLPGIFADSLPDKFGNQLIDLYMAEKNIPPESISPLDRLLYVGARGMGALEYHPAVEVGDENNSAAALDIHLLSELAEQVTSRDKRKHNQFLKTTNRQDALRLIRVGSSAGGSRSKALVAQDPKGMPKIEYIYSRIAGICGIDMPQTDYIDDGDDFHFLIERFDRVAREGRIGKVHYGSWAGFAHADRDPVGTQSYEQLVLLSRQLGLGQDSVTQIFRRAVFNVVGRNQAYHTKNFGFLMDKADNWNSHRPST